MQAIKSTRLDERIHRTLVDLAAIHAGAKVKQALEQSTFFSGGDDGFHRLLSCALHRPQAIANHFVAHGLKSVVAAVHIGRLKGQAKMVGGILKQNF